MQTADGFTWTSPEGVTGYVRAALPDTPAALPTERNSHAAVAIDSDLLILGGESNAELVHEMCMVDTEQQVIKSLFIPSWVVRQVQRHCLLQAVCMLRWPLHMKLAFFTPFPAEVKFSSTCLLSSYVTCKFITLGSLDCQGALAWVEPILNGPAPAPRKGASAACTQNRFVVIFGGKGVDADGKEGLKEDLLLLELEGGPSTIKVSSLDIKGVKPAPRMNAMLQVRIQTTRSKLD